MRATSFEKVLYWMVRAGAYVLPFTLLMVTHSTFFPFIVGKGFAFRIIVELMTAAWISLLIIDFKKYWPRWSFVSAALTAFVGIVFVTSLFGADFNNSFWSNFERMEGIITYLHILFLFFILVGTFHTKREWFIILGISVFASVLVAFYGLLEATGEVVSFADSSRIISTLGNPLYVAAYLSFNIFLSIFLFLQTKSSAIRWLLSGAILFESGIFFMTGARGAFIGILSGLGTIAFLLLVTADSRRKKVIFSGIIGVVLLVPIALFTFKDSPLVQESSQLSRFASITLQSGEARLTIWKMAFESFKERPILGWGAGNFVIPFAKHYDPRMFNQEPWFDRTHNMPLEWLVGSGIIGFLAYCALFISIIPALIQGVRRNSIEQSSAFIFIGMFVSYVVQLLFVFDTQATYMMLILMLGFFHSIHSHTDEEWLHRNTIVDIQSEDPDFGWQSRKQRRALGIRLDKSTEYVSISFYRAGAILSVFSISSLLVWAINIKPILANQTLINAFSLFNQQQFTEAEAAFKEALRLSRGTVGTEEVREHIAFNMYTLFQNPELMKKPGGEALYHLAVEEMEKQIAENSKKDLKVKQNILLAQLYHQWTLLFNDQSALAKAFEQYQQAIQFAPNYVSVYPIVANLYAQSGNINEATHLIEKATDLLTEAGKYDARVFYSKALFYTAQRRYEDAYAVLEDINATYSLGEGLDAEMMDNIILATRSQGAGAIPFLEKVYGIDKTVTGTVLMLAQLYAAEGNKDKARFYAQEALKMDPSIKEKVQEFLKAISK